jgi:fumarate hydratase subunit beta
MSALNVSTPLTDDVIREMRIGEQVLLSGFIYTARDAAHKKLVELITGNEPLPLELQGSVIYYVGPSPARPGAVIGAAGPTTSYRMDPYTPLMLDNGVKGMIGKGPRSEDVIESMKSNCAVYFGATGGAAALLSKSIVEAQLLAFEELGPEALRRLTVVDMPLIVINDCYGNDLYKEGVREWAQT